MVKYESLITWLIYRIPINKGVMHQISQCSYVFCKIYSLVVAKDANYFHAWYNARSSTPYFLVCANMLNKYSSDNNKKGQWVQGHVTKKPYYMLKTVSDIVFQELTSRCRYQKVSVQVQSSHNLQKLRSHIKNIGWSCKQRIIFTSYWLHHKRIKSSTSQIFNPTHRKCSYAL